MSEIYVFDMDGVLIDSMLRFKEGLLRILDEENILYDDNLIDILTPLGYEGTAEYYVTVMGVKDTIENIVERMNKILYEQYANHIILKEGVQDYVEKLSSQNARMFVLTASPHLMTDICLQKNGIYDKFEAIWSVDEFGGLTKSDIQLFHVVADKIGCKPEDIHYFDDNIIAIQNATKANYNTFAVEDRQSKEVLKQLKATAKHYVHSFKQLRS